MKDRTKIKLGVVKKVRAYVSCKSLIYSRGTFPLSWGNYFWIDTDIRVLNFWSENLEELVRRKILDDGMVEVISYNDEYCIIDDSRIPEDWYYNKLCTTGGYSPSIEIAKEIYDYLGDPDNEFEKYIDPVSYYIKRGKEYDIKTGIIHYKMR